MSTQYRTETDSMGEIQVDASKYWGAQTQRSIKYFSIGSDYMPVEVVHGLARLKKAAARANREMGLLDQDKAELIVQAADEVISGKLDEHFPLRVWMTGSGTQSNMNVNEVIANRAIEIAGGELGSKNPVHPNDHVNMSQSSNDTFPTAMNMAIAHSFVHRLLPAVRTMRDELLAKEKEWASVVKIGRTHMQDAVPLTLGQEFSGYRVMMDDNIKRIEHVLEEVYHLAIGGTALGTGINTPEGFAELVASKIAEITELPFVSAPNKFAVMGAHDGVVAASGVLKTLANSLYKIANDIRLLSCGPRAGFHELLLPENEPGSSIMPGKVNPTQCEAMAMVAAQVMGYDAATGFAGAGGMLEMNVYKPMMAFNMINSVRMMADSCTNFSEYLLKGTRPNYRKIDNFVHQSLMLVTALSPVIGYDKASKLAHYANEHDVSLKEANAVLQFVDDEEYDRIIDPEKMCYPGK